MSKVKPIVTPDLYHSSEDNSHRFYKIPKELCNNRCYRVNLTSDAKLIYAMLLDRMELSRKNGWVNERREIYLLFTKESVSNILGISETTVYKSFKQLELYGLIHQKRQGLNKPNMIYIGKVKPEFIGICGICSSRSTENECQDKLNTKGNDTDCSETEINETEIMGSLSDDKASDKQKTVDFNSFISLYKYRIDPSVEESIERYINIYRRRVKDKHPNLTEKQWERVVDEWLTIDREAYDDVDIDADVINEIMDIHFATKYTKGNYSIMHFISGDIRKHRYYEWQRSGDYEEG